MRTSFLPGGTQGRAVAVTGLGVVASAGIGKDAFFEGLSRPAPPGTRIVTEFDPTPWFGPKDVRRVDRFAQMGVAAAEMALDDAGRPEVDPDRAGVIIGTGVGGLSTLEEQILVHHEKGARRVSPFLVPMMMGNAAAGNVSIRNGWRGPCETTVTACAAGTHAVGNAARLVATGRCDVVLAGGAEAAATPVAMAGFSNMTALSNSGISRPFDSERDGFVMAEAAGVLLLEDLDRALARGAHIYAIVAGAASNADAHHITAPSPGGAGAAACMELALEDAGIDPSEVRHINAHGTSTPLNDAAEAEAISKVFGTPGPAVTSTKGVTGHALGAAGAIEAVALALTIDRAVIPPTAGHEHPDPDIHLDLVLGQPRSWAPGPALSNSFGFGGHNGTLVFIPHRG
ncbi:MAG: beta-ketoacyl-[acyl-carrier-protein] synthase family protein [Acidimicrobiales bacterium]